MHISLIRIGHKANLFYCYPSQCPRSIFANSTLPILDRLQFPHLRRYDIFFFLMHPLVVENVRFLFPKLINYKFIIISIINLLSIILDDRSIISLRGIDPCYSSVTKIVLTYTNILAFDLEIYFNFYPRKIKRVFLYDF